MGTASDRLRRVGPRLRNVEILEHDLLDDETLLLGEIDGTQRRRGDRLAVALRPRGRANAKPDRPARRMESFQRSGMAVPVCRFGVSSNARQGARFHRRAPVVRLYDPCADRGAARNERSRPREAAAFRAGRLAASAGSIRRALLTVLLNAGRAQAGKAVLVDRVLPGKKFLDRQCVTAACLFKRKKSAADRGDHLRLAADDPTLRSRRRQISDRQRRTVRPDDVFDPRAMGRCHCTLTTRTPQTRTLRTAALNLPKRNRGSQGFCRRLGMVRG